MTKTDNAIAKGDLLLEWAAQAHLIDRVRMIEDFDVEPWLVCMEGKRAITRKLSQFSIDKRTAATIMREAWAASLSRNLAKRRFDLIVEYGATEADFDKARATYASMRVASGHADELDQRERAL